MKKPLLYILTMTVAVNIGLIIASGIIVSQTQVADYSCEGRTTYWYRYPDESGSWHVEQIRFDITEEDFENSKSRTCIRFGNEFFPYYRFVEPDNRFVRHIAEELYQDDLSDRGQVLKVVNFVRSAFAYRYDSEQQRVENYAMTPTELIWTGKGDCEDVSILAVSILRAMGFESVLLQYPEHIKAGVYLDGILYPCECTSDPGRELDKSRRAYTVINENTVSAKMGDYIDKYRTGLYSIFKI